MTEIVESQRCDDASGIFGLRCLLPMGHVGSHETQALDGSQYQRLMAEYEKKKRDYSWARGLERIAKGKQ